MIKKKKITLRTDNFSFMIRVVLCRLFCNLTLINGLLFELIFITMFVIVSSVYQIHFVQLLKANLCIYQVQIKIKPLYLKCHCYRSNNNNNNAYF